MALRICLPSSNLPPVNCLFILWRNGSPFVIYVLKRISNAILIFLQTIRHHKREHGVHKITHGLGVRMTQRGEEEEWEEDGAIVTTQCWLGPMLQTEQGCLKKIMKRASTSHTAGLNQSVRDSKNVHHLFSARSLSCSPKKKKKKHNFEYISRHNFSANQK